MTTGCAIHVGRVNGRVLVRIVGEIDASNADRLEDTLALVGDGPLVVDCSRLSFMGSVGIEVLAEAARTRGTVRLRNPSLLLRRVIGIGGWRECFEFDVTTPGVG